MTATIKGLDRLARRVVEAQSSLVHLVEQSALHLDGAVTWGQFLDSPRKVGQYGIYGTSAAIRILAGADHTENSPLISKALRALPEVGPSDLSERIYDSTDLAITFKVTAILDAAQPQRLKFESVEPIETRILAQVIDGHGWGNYHDTADQDDSPRLLPTAHAMISLRRSRQFRTSGACARILDWFCHEVLRGQPLPKHEAALALLVLVEYASEGVQSCAYGTARADLQEQLTIWAQRERTPILAETTSNHYWAVSNGVPHNQYLFYVPDLLGALALLRSGNPKKARRRVLKIVDALCSSISAQNGFRSATSRRIASVDQLWAWLLLQEFHQIHQQQPQLLVRPLAYLVTATLFRRFAASTTMAVVGALGTLAGVLGSLPVVVRAAGGAIATVSLGLLVSLLVVWLRGD